MNRIQKIELLRKLQSGTFTLNDLKFKTAIVIQKEGLYNVNGTTGWLNRKEFENYIVGMKQVLVLPDNGRDDMTT